MSLKQILTYPYETKYRVSDWGSQVKDGRYGSIPCSNAVYAGKYAEVAGNISWYGDGTGQDNAADCKNDTRHFIQPNEGVNQRGLAYWVSTSANNSEYARWFDIGAEGGRSEGYPVDIYARSSWLRDVTSLWFLFNGHDTTQTRGCYAAVQYLAIRYRDPNGNLKFKKANSNIGDLGLMEYIRGDTKRMVGYQLSTYDKEEICSNDYRFLGLRIQIRLIRGSGTISDYLQGGVSGIRLGLGRNYSEYNTTYKKRALVGYGFQDWDTFDPNNIRLETR